MQTLPDTTFEFLSNLEILWVNGAVVECWHLEHISRANCLFGQVQRPEHQRTDRAAIRNLWFIDCASRRVSARVSRLALACARAHAPPRPAPPFFTIFFFNLFLLATQKSAQQQPRANSIWSIRILDRVDENVRPVHIYAPLVFSFSSLTDHTMFSIDW